jgi:hypothetical protein
MRAGHHRDRKREYLEELQSRWKGEVPAHAEELLATA